MAASESLDDDFGDFGGFEAADPITVEAVPVAECVDTTASPWTVMAAATLNPAGDQSAPSQAPDIDQSAQSPSPGDVSGPSDPQERLHKLNEPGAATDWAAVGEDLHNTVSNNAPLFEANFDCIGEASGSQALNEQSSIDKPSEHIPVTPGRDRTPSPFHTADTVTATESCQNASSKIDGLSLDEFDDLTTTERVNLNKKSDTHTNMDQIESDTTTGRDLEKAKAENQLLESAKKKLQQELEDLAKQNKLQESRVEILEKRLQEATLKHEQTQTKHAAELEEMRTSGQNAISIIVEEYKEMCKVAVLQQQADSLKMLKSLMVEEVEKHEESMRKQEEKFAEKFGTLRREMEEKADENLRTQRINAEETHRKLLEKAVEEERLRSNDLQEESKVRWKEDLENIRKENDKLLVETMEREQQKCEEHVEELFAERMKQHEKNAADLKTDTQANIKEYVQENREAERSNRRHILHSSELLLEAAKQQISLLLQPDTKNSDTHGTDNIS